MTVVDGPDIGLHNQRQRDYFEGTDQRTLKPTGSRYLRRHVDRVAEFAAITSGDRVLEVGCGLGRYTLLLAERGVAVEGLDLSPSLLEQLRSTPGAAGIPLHAHDLLECPPEMLGSFDAVIGFFVLHHVHDLDACVQMATALVRPGGRVAFLEPNPWNPLYYVQIFATPEMSWQPERGMLSMRPNKIMPIMSAAGLVDVRFERFGLFPPFVTNRKMGADLESAAEGVPLGVPARPFALFGGRRPT
ncbi:MAG TPA: methyltransferase domain-containing protein [Acidimicrobiales bacterium]|nr:methyltransferase domain-containing protein [Acidimicrobiales bacterium]